MSTDNLLRRLLLYGLGLFLMALGVVASVRSDLGISPVNSLPYVLSQTTGVDQGLLTTLVFCLFIFCQILLLRRDFSPIQLFQAVCAAAFGSFVTLCGKLMRFAAPENYFLRLLLLTVSILLISAGMFLYLCADLIPQPAEGLCLAVQKRTEWKYADIKVGFDCLLVCLAAGISLAATGRIVGIREGTVVTTLCVGRIVGFLSKKWKAGMTAFCGAG